MDLHLRIARWVLSISLGRLSEEPQEEAPEEAPDGPVMVTGEWIGSRPTTTTLGFTLPSTSYEYEEEE